MSCSTLPANSLPNKGLAVPGPSLDWLRRIADFWWRGWVDNWRPVVHAEAAIRGTRGGGAGSIADRKVIVRTWSGTVAATDSDAYAAYLHRTGLKDFRATPGNLGAFAFRRTEGDRVVFTTLSIWDGMDGIRRFAGDDVERARFYEEDDRFLIDRDWTVTHTEVVFAEMAGG